MEEKHYRCLKDFHSFFELIRIMQKAKNCVVKPRNTGPWFSKLSLFPTIRKALFFGVKVSYFEVVHRYLKYISYFDICYFKVCYSDVHYFNIRCFEFLLYIKEWGEVVESFSLVAVASFV